MSLAWTQNDLASLLLVKTDGELADDSLVDVSLSRLCITQREISSYGGGGLNRARFAMPFIVGCAACCYVVNARGSKFRVGDLVIPSPVRGTTEPNGEVIFRSDRFGSAYAGTALQAGFLRDFFRVPERDLLGLSPNVPPDTACLAEPLAVALHATRKMQVKSTSSVLILAETNPVAEIIARLIAPKVASIIVHTERAQSSEIEVNKVSRRSTRTIELKQVYQSLEDDARPDVIFEVSNNPLAMDVALAVAAEGATVVFIHEPGYPVSFDSKTASEKDLQLHTIFSCGDCLADAVSFLKQAWPVLRGMIKMEFSFFDADEALKYASTSRSDLRTVQILGTAKQ